MPAYAVQVGPATPNPTHHAALVAEDGTIIGLILCDASGDRLPTAVSRSNLQTIPVKTSTGDSQYSDQELPFFTSAQQDWIGGIGNERFEDIRTKYAAGRRVQSVGNTMVLGPREHFTTGYKPMVVNVPTANVGSIGRLKWHSTHDPNAISTQFTTVDALTAPRLHLLCKPVGAETGQSHNVTWIIANDDAGGALPGTVLGTGTVNLGASAGDGEIMRWASSAVVANFLPNLAGATTYWLTLIPDAAATATTHLELGYESEGASTNTVISTDGGATWAGSAHDVTDFELMFKISREDGLDRGWLWYYRQCLMFITRPTTGAPVLLRSGWRRVCDPNGGNLLQLLDGTQATWAGNAAVGAIAWVFAGPGSDDEVPYREVTASVAGVLTVNVAWDTAHTIDTEYILLGTDRWEVVTHTIPNPTTGRPAIGVGGSPPSDEEVIAYIPQGHTAGEIWMYREYNNAGTYTIESKGINDATGGAGSYRTKLMVAVHDDTLGPVLVKVEDNISTGATGIVAEARVPGTWGIQLAWGGDEQLGDSQPSSLVNAIEFVNPTNDARDAWATSRGELFARATGVIPALWAPILLPELKAFASERTGYALAVFNASLYLSLGGGLLERLTGGNTLTDVGPTKGIGLPPQRIGEIESLVSYPGKLFVATTPTGILLTEYSSITQLTGLDSHDVIYEAPRGRRIYDMQAQKIPTLFTGISNDNNRLWFQEGSELMYIDLPSQGTNPITDPNYQFAAEGMVTSSRIYASLNDRLKVFSSLKVVSDNLDSTLDVGEGTPQGSAFIIPEYQVDTDIEGVQGNWRTPFGDPIYGTSPSQEIFLTDYTPTVNPNQVVPVRGRYLRHRLHLNTTAYAVSPVVRATLLESLVSLPNKFAFKTTVLFEDNQKDLRDDQYTDARAWQQAGRLQEYAEQMEVFTMLAPSSTLDGAKVIISPPEVAPIAISKDAITTEGQISEERLIGTLSIIQVVLPDLNLIP